MLLKVGVACLDLPRVEVIQGQRLRERKDGFGTRMATQRPGNLRLTVVAADVAQPRHALRLSLPGHDGPEDRQARLARNITADWRQLDVHLLQGFLHRLNMPGPMLY